VLKVFAKNIGPLANVELVIKGVTILTGESGSGKSMLVQSIHGATINKFPSSLLKFGESAFYISFDFDDNEKVIWEKKNKTSATITYAGEVLSKTSKYTVENLANFLNMEPLDIGGNKINIHFIDQFEPPLIKNFSHKKLSDILSASSEVDRASQLLKKVKDESLRASGSFNTLQSLLGESGRAIENLNKKVEVGSIFKQQFETGLRRNEILHEKLILLDYVIDMCNKYNSLNELFLKLTRKIDLLKVMIAKKQRLFALETLERDCSLANEFTAKLIGLNHLLEYNNKRKHVKALLVLADEALINWDKCTTLAKKIENIKKFTERHICPICGEAIKNA
jgi:predicted ATP-binding protein involved in virulence